MIRNYDDNKDGKIDRRVISREGQVLREEKSTRFNNHFDLVTEYSSYKSDDQPVLVKTYYDKNKKVNRIEGHYELRNHNRSLQKITIYDDKGKVQREWSSSVALDQTNQCQQLGNREVDALSNEAESALIQLNGGYLNVGLGHRVHQSCLEGWGRDRFVNTLTSAIETGMQCLNSLGDGNNGARVNHTQLESLFNESKVSVICHQTEDRNWRGVYAHASIGPTSRIENPPLNHPYISINPTLPRTIDEGEIKILEKTLFHEQLHNLGHRHGHSIEYPYACEDCCFPEGTSERDNQKKTLGCKVCAGDYTSDIDQRYILDVIEWGQASYSFDHGQKASVRYLQQNPEDAWGYAAHAVSTSDVFDPLGSSIAALVRQQFPQRNAEVNALLERAENFKSNPLFDFARPMANILAEGHMSLYKDLNSSNTISILETNKSALKTFLDQAKNIPDSDNRKYVADSIKNHLRETIYKVWLDKYPHNDDTLSLRSFALVEFFEL